MSADSWPVTLTFRAVAFRLRLVEGLGSTDGGRSVTEWCPDGDVELLSVVDSEGHRFQIGSDALVVQEPLVNFEPGVAFFVNGQIVCEAGRYALDCAGGCEWTSEPFETHGEFRPCKLLIPYRTFVDGSGVVHKMIDTENFEYAGQRLVLKTKVDEKHAFARLTWAVGKA